MWQFNSKAQGDRATTQQQSSGWQFNSKDQDDRVKTGHKSRATNQRKNKKRKTNNSFYKNSTNHYDITKKDSYAGVSSLSHMELSSSNCFFPLTSIMYTCTYMLVNWAAPCLEALWGGPDTAVVAGNDGLGDHLGGQKLVVHIALPGHRDVWVCVCVYAGLPEGGEVWAGNCSVSSHNINQVGKYIT